MSQTDYDPVFVARDNLVCAICKLDLTDGAAYAIVSHPSKKGVVVFSCHGHLNESMGLLSRLL